MMSDSIIVLDTNVISDIFEVSPNYYNFIITCLDQVKEYIYLTDTILHELSPVKSKPYIIPSFNKEKQKVLAQVNSYINKEICAIEKLKKYEEILTDMTMLDGIIDIINENQAKIEEMLNQIIFSKLVEPALSSVEKNYVKEFIDSIQQCGRVGNPLQRSASEKVSYQVEKNAESGGIFPDKKKKGVAKFNDYFIVEELKILAKTMAKNIIFVTSDSKGNFQEEKLKTEFQTDTGYELKIKSGSEFYREIADCFKISQEDITELFLIENQFEFLQELQTQGKSQRIIENYLYSDIEGEDEDIGYLDIDLYDVEIDSFNDYEVSYFVTGNINAEKTFYEYWGRDDDTKEIITSPANYKSYTGDIKLFITRKFDVKDGIIETKHIDCEIIDTSSLEEVVNTWGEDDYY